MKYITLYSAMRSTNIEQDLFDAVHKALSSMGEEVRNLDWASMAAHVRNTEEENLKKAA